MDIYKTTIGLFESGLSRLDRLFNKIYTSDYNPIYRSGTIAVVLLAMACVSGLILLFFYRVSEPHESLAAIGENWWFAGWIRSFHRYSSDGMVVAVVFHIFRMWAQGKGWGKRTFPWITGVVLLLMTLATAWSGFVLMWDFQAQSFLLTVSKLIDSLGILSTPLSQGFDGSALAPDKSFFFFTLFFHVVVPLVMIFGIWVHTMKLARATWFPRKKLAWSIVGVFVLLSLCISAPLGEKANLLGMLSEYKVNAWYMFWLPLMDRNPLAVFWGAAAVFALLAAAPFILRPRKENRPPASTLDKDVCNGCNQCVVDCPYEAISLVDRIDKGDEKLSDKHAVVDTDLCVSCALCTASCPVFTIGPKGRTSIDQHKNANAFLREVRSKKKDGEKIVVISCVNQPHSAAKLRDLEKRHPNVSVFPIECMGTLHMRTIGQMSAQTDQIILAACPERNCSNKDAHMLLRERKSGERMPGLPGRADKSKVHLVSMGDGEEYKVERLVQKFTNKAPMKGALPRWAGAGLVTFALLSLMAFASSVPWTGKALAHGKLRLSWKLQSQKISFCEEVDEHLQSPLSHMRLDQECTHVYPDYRLQLYLGDKKALDKKVSHSGRNKRSSLYVFEELALDPGVSKARVVFAANTGELENMPKESPLIEFDRTFNIKIERGKITLIYFDKMESGLVPKYYHEDN